MDYMILSMWHQYFMIRISFDPLLFPTFPKPPASIPPTLRHVAAPGQHIGHHKLKLSTSWRLRWLLRIHWWVEKKFLPSSSSLCLFLLLPSWRQEHIPKQFQSISKGLPTKVRRNWDITLLPLFQVPSSNIPNGWRSQRFKRRLENCGPILFHLKNYSIHILKQSCSLKMFRLLRYEKLIIPIPSQTWRNQHPLTSHRQHQLRGGRLPGAFRATHRGALRRGAASAKPLLGTQALGLARWTNVEDMVDMWHMWYGMIWNDIRYHIQYYIYLYIIDAMSIPIMCRCNHIYNIEIHTVYWNMYWNKEISIVYCFIV